MHRKRIGGTKTVGENIPATSDEKINVIIPKVTAYDCDRDSKYKDAYKKYSWYHFV